MLDQDTHDLAWHAIQDFDMNMLASILLKKLPDFKISLSASLAEEKGQEVLKPTVNAIFINLQRKISQLLEDELWTE